METYKLDFIEFVVQRLPKMMSDDVALWIACQFALESNYGRSELAINCHNISGMKHPLTRLSMSTNANSRGFAVYYQLEDCIEDYLLWLAWHRPYKSELTEVPRFASLISTKNYCPEKDYITKINKLYQQFKTLKK